MTNTRYLGEEKLSKLMLKFSIPCVLSLLISSLYNIVDQIFIGNSRLSTLGNAATGIVFPIFIIAQAFAWWFGDGTAAFLNICQGKQDTQSAHKAVGTGITLTFLASVLLMAIFYPIKTPLLNLLGASENNIAYSIEYFDVVLAFFPFFLLSNMINSVVRADGSPRWAMFAIVVGAVVNLALDPLFIFVFDWGMKGAAWATGIGQAASFVFNVVYLFRSKTFKLTLKSFIPDFKCYLGSIKLGVSTFITQMSIVALALVLNYSLKKYGGESVYGEDIPLAVISIQSKVFTIMINLVVGIVLGCQPIISYNVGAKKYTRVRKLFKYMFISTLIVGVVCTAIFELMPLAVAKIFGEPTNIPNPDDYWVFAKKCFRIFLSLSSFTCFIKLTAIFFQAVGKPVHAAISSFARDLVFFVPICLIIPRFGGVEAILYASPISDVLAMIIATLLTVRYFKTLPKKDGSQEDAQQTAIQPSKPGYIITIAREHGSGGKQIGKLLAKKLNIPFYCKELTALAAQESGLDKEFISDLADNRQESIFNLYLSTNVATQAIIAQERIIKKIADQGSAVIVGRAADYVLKDYNNVIRIFIHADENYKKNRIMMLYGDSESDALKHTKKSDEARSSYYQTISGLRWGERKNYHLTVNASCGIECTVNTLLAFVENR